MRKKTIFVVLIICASFYLTACSSHEEKVKIGILIGSSLREEKVEGLIEGLKEYDYFKDENTQYIIKNAKDQIHLLPSLAAEIVVEKPDVIVVTGEVEALAVKRATKDIPIVFIGVGIPAEIGLTKNITGIDSYYVELSGKRLEFFKKLLPNIKRIALIFDQNNTPSKPSIINLEKIAQKLNIEIILKPCSDKEDVVAAMNSVDPLKYDGVMLLCSLLIVSATDELHTASLEKGLPIMGVSESQTKKGIFASYSAVNYEMGVQSSRMVANILKGENPANIPIEAPSTVNLVVNMETAKKMGLKLDTSVLTYATKILGDYKNEE